MRSRAMFAGALVATAIGSACAVRERPYHVSSPMLGAASVPAPRLRARPVRPESIENRVARAVPIRVVTAPRIREASAEAASAVVANHGAQARSALAHPHRIPEAVPLPPIRTPDDLRTLVGRRDSRDATILALGWVRDLGRQVDPAATEDLVAWARETGRLDPADGATPGDLIVFDQAVSERRADLVAVVIARDERGVSEILYLGGGVIRRGFVDPARPRTRRDIDDRVVNTFLRHGRRWPAPGTRYLAGELYVHLIRTR